MTRIFTRYASSNGKKSASSRRWLDRASRDPYTREAKERDFKSRAAFKLLQIDAKFKLFAPDQHIVDLGFAPGAWSQVAYERTGKTGTILGIDILPSQPIPGVSSMQANILSKQTHENIRKFFLEKEILKSHKLKDEELMSYIDREMEQMKISDEVLKSGKVLTKYPLDVVLSDMCAPFLQTTGFWNSTTNAPFYRMANTSGLQVKDHLNSMVGKFLKSHQL